MAKPPPPPAAEIFFLGPGRNGHGRCNGRRPSEREAAKRLERQFKDDMPEARVPGWDSIRKFHSKFEKRRQDGKSFETVVANLHAIEILSNARRRRAVVGWDASPWLFIPGMLEWVINNGEF